MKGSVVLELPCEFDAITLDEIVISCKMHLCLFIGNWDATQLSLLL